MKIEKDYLHNNFASLEISRNKFLGGIILGLFYAFIIYSLFYLTRESFRLLSIIDNYHVWILSDAEVNFYNLFYSFISVIFAQSICFSYWLSGSRKYAASHNYRKISIINDQNVLNWTFLFWFAKMAVLYVTFFGFLGGFYVFSLYPDYNYLFIIIIIVLYLHSWISIRRAFKNKSLKWMFISILIVSGLSLGLSRINLIDYRKFNETFLELDICHKYNIDIPESDVYIEEENRSLVKNIYVAFSNKTNSKIPVLIINNKIVAFSDLTQIIGNWLECYDETDIPRIVFLLHIDKNVPMSFVNNLKKELSNSCVSKIAFAVLPKIRKYDKRYYRNYSLMHRIPCYSFSNLMPPLNESYYDLKNYENIIEIKTVEKDHCYFNKNAIIIYSLKDKIKEQITKNQNYIVKFTITPTDNFSSYLELLSIINEAISELRNEYAQTFYLNEFENLDMDKKWIIENKIPLRIFENSDP